MLNSSKHPGPSPVWYTRRQAAKYLGYKESALAYWACIGRPHLPYYKIGQANGRVRYSKADLDAFLEAHRVEQPEVA